MKLNITKRDIDMLILPDPGWYKAKLITQKDKESNDKKSMTVELNFNLTENADGIAADKDIPYWVSEKGLGFHIHIFEAFLGKQINEEEEFDFEDYLNQMIYVKIEHEPSAKDPNRQVATISDATALSEPPF